MKEHKKACRCMYMKRDLQKRPPKETPKSDVQARPTPPLMFVIGHHRVATVSCGVGLFCRSLLQVSFRRYTSCFTSERPVQDSCTHTLTQTELLWDSFVGLLCGFLLYVSFHTESNVLSQTYDSMANHGYSDHSCVKWGKEGPSTWPGSYIYKNRPTQETLLYKSLL